MLFLYIPQMSFSNIGNLEAQSKDSNFVEMTCSIESIKDDRLVLNLPQYFMRYIDFLQVGSKMTAKAFSAARAGGSSASCGSCPSSMSRRGLFATMSNSSVSSSASIFANSVRRMTLGAGKGCAVVQNNGSLSGRLMCTGPPAW